MEFKDFLRKRRGELDLSQADLAQLLSDRDIPTTSGRVGHWETGRNRPPLEEIRFREILAIVQTTPLLVCCGSLLI